MPLPLRPTRSVNGPLGRRPWVRPGRDGGESWRTSPEVDRSETPLTHVWGRPLPGPTEGQGTPPEAGYPGLPPRLPPGPA